MNEKELTYEELNAVVVERLKTERLNNIFTEIKSIIDEDKEILNDPKFIEMMKGFNLKKNV